jgi:3-hydroxyisobutyrate dehydrogenase-like beta-hydroxyacid dehydrogenase
MRETIGVIGLGLMGTALTERLLGAGFAVAVYNRTPEKAEPLLALGAKWSDNPLTECDRVLISLYTTETVEEVLGKLESGLRNGQILLDTTTGDPTQTAALGARLAEQGVRYLDAPISGSSEQTRRGEVTTLVGGDREAFETCRDLFDCFSAKTFHVGRCGNGSKMKLVSNLVMGLNRAALAEGLVFAEMVEVAPADALQVLKESLAYSRVMDTKGEKMVQGDFTTQARLTQHLKDVRLMVDIASVRGVSLFLSEAHRRLLERAEAAGFGEADNSAVIRAYAQATQAGTRSQPRSPHYSRDLTKEPI